MEEELVIKLKIYKGKLFALFLVLIIFVFVYGTCLVLAISYKDKVQPNLYIGDLGIGGMEKQELQSFLQKMYARVLSEGIKFSYKAENETRSFVLFPVIVAGEDSVELLSLDTSKETNRLVNYQKDRSVFLQAIKILPTLFGKKRVNLENISLQEDKLSFQLAEKISQNSVKPKNAGVKINSISPLDYEITPAQSGTLYNLDEAVQMVKESVQMLDFGNIYINSSAQVPVILESDVQSAISKLEILLNNSGFKLTYTNNETKQEYSWTFGPKEFKDLIELQKLDNQFVFGLNKEKTIVYLEKVIGTEINVEPENAKFKIGENGKVTEFKGSRAGIKLDTEKNYDLLNQQLIEQNQLLPDSKPKIIGIQFTEAVPKVSTGEVNDLGIKDMLGVGVSDYSNSPTNRIKNIKNAVNKLNGVLIKPGEEFSTISYTAPFTLEGGYYPELVIKGDEMKPEVGGGLCQIGTTLFRMAMNSGMPITQRRNHSLVVGHYNDPVNHLPGTDATVYDPIPDFRFLNDTGNYVLIQTFLDVKNQDVIFTLWGTSDGRKGFYTHPIVLNWIPAGEPKDIETTKLEPGKKTCQNAFRGANTTFTYTRILPDGTKEDKVFDSYYRPLPKICLVGVAAVVTSSTSDGILPEGGLEVQTVVE